MLDEVVTSLHVFLENTKKFTIVTIFTSGKQVMYVLLLLLQLQRSVEMHKADSYHPGGYGSQWGVLTSS